MVRCGVVVDVSSNGRSRLVAVEQLGKQALLALKNKFFDKEQLAMNHVIQCFVKANSVFK